MQGVRGERGETGIIGYPGHMVCYLELFILNHTNPFKVSKRAGG